MPQQRIHKITSERLARLKSSINEERKTIGEKLLTTPDLMEDIVEMFETKRNRVMKKIIKDEKESK